MIPLCVPNLSGREAEYLARCVETTFVSTVGEFVGQFEGMVAVAAGAPEAVATSAGTTGLHAAYVAAGVKPGDLVVAPALTFIATANAISHAGASPWLFDVDHESWTLDVRQLSEALTNKTAKDDNGVLVHKSTGRRVAAITPVFTLGIPADMTPIVELGSEFGIPVIVDGAAALGSTYQGRLSGDLGADLTMYSFNGNKITTAGGGGAVTGHDQKLLARLRHLTTTARVGADYDHDMVGFNYRMTNLQAAVGCAQMEQLDDFVAAKRRIALTYRDAFSERNSLAAFPEPEGRESAHWFAGFRFEGRDGPQRSIDLRQHLREAGIDARPFWKPMHLQKPYENAPRETMDVSEDLWESIVTLPCSTHLTNDDQSYVIDTVLKWLDEN